MKSEIIYIHGISFTREDGYSDKMARGIGSKFKHTELNWDKMVSVPFDKYFDENYLKPKWHRKKKRLTYRLRKGMGEFAGDVIIYESMKEYILNVLKDMVEGDRDVIIISHSMGTIITDDFLTKYRPKNVVKVITLGSPLAIFRLGSVLENASGEYDWDNYMEPNDILATKLSKVEGYGTVKDIEFNSCHWVKSFNILAHSTYMRSRKLIAIIRESLNDL